MVITGLVLCMIVIVLGTVSDTVPTKAVAKRDRY